MEEIDIWRTANDSHGDNAWLDAAQRADHALEDGKQDAFAVWKRVLKAVTELHRQQPKPPSPQLSLDYDEAKDTGKGF